MAIEPFTPQDLDEIDQALDQLEAVLARLISLTGRDRQRLYKMGDKTEAFCRQALTVLDRNRRAFPETLPLDTAIAQLATIDQMRPRTKRVLQLAERMRDSELELGAGVARVARKGYSAIRDFGDNQGLENLYLALSRRFNRRPRRNAGPEEDDQAA